MIYIIFHMVAGLEVCNMYTWSCAFLGLKYCKKAVNSLSHYAQKHRVHLLMVIALTHMQEAVEHK
jgi:orotidine-5'-phosphate decarboxylase